MAVEREAEATLVCTAWLCEKLGKGSSFRQVTEETGSVVYGVLRFVS